MHAVNLLPRAVFQQSHLNSKEEYRCMILKWKVNQTLIYLGMQNRFQRNLLDVVYVMKLLTLRRNFWGIVMAIGLLHLTTYVLTCGDLLFRWMADVVPPVTIQRDGKARSSLIISYYYK